MHDSFGTVPGCIGSSSDMFKQRILKVHSNKAIWMDLPNQGLEYIHETHSEKEVTKQWSNIIIFGADLIKRRCEIFLRSEEEYKKQYPDVMHMLAGNTFLSSLHHNIFHG